MSALRHGSLEALLEHVIELTTKHGNPNGTPYEQGVNDHGFRMVGLLKDSLAHPAPEQVAEASGVWAVGSWLSAALDDPSVCDAMKADIREWFDEGGSVRTPSAQTDRAEAQDAAVGGLLERLPQSLAVIKGLALRRLEGAKHDASRKWRSRRGDQASYMVEAREHATVGSVPLNALLDVIEAASLAMQGGSDG